MLQDGETISFASSPGRPLAVCQAPDGKWVLRALEEAVPAERRSVVGALPALRGEQRRRAPPTGLGPNICTRALLGPEAATAVCGRPDAAAHASC